MSEFNLIKVSDLMNANVRIGRDIARETNFYAHSAAELLVRNLAVIGDRMSPNDYSELTNQTKEKFEVMVFISKDLAPKEDNDIIDYGSEDENLYRRQIVEPIGSFQRLTHSWDSRKTRETDPLTMSKHRFAIEAASIAFSGALGETYTKPAINETLKYFQNNTVAANLSLANEQLKFQNSL